MVAVLRFVRGGSGVELCCRNCGARSCDHVGAANLRFASEASLKTFLNKIGRLRGVKGGPLKKNALDLINAAQTVINRGVTLWTSRTKSKKP